MKKNSDLNILFLDILTDEPKLKRDLNKALFGARGYSEGMRKVFGIEKKSWHHLDAGLGKLPDEVAEYDAVVIGGSAEDPIDEAHEKPWMKDTYRFIKKIIDKNIPILGICGGLQFTARALNKKVIKNPQGRELGIVSLDLNTLGQNDPLFKGMKKKMQISVSHKCMVEKIDKEWKLLGSSKICDFQAIAIGKNIRLLQFHPEMGSKEIKALTKNRKESLIKEGFFTNEKAFKKFLTLIKDNKNIGIKIAQNFIKNIVLPGKKDKLTKGNN